MKTRMVLLAAGMVLWPLTALAADTTVQIPVGDWVAWLAGFLRDILVSALMAVVLWIARMLSPAVAAWLSAQRTAAIEQLLQRAVDYGLNAVVGAARGQQLPVNVGSEVLAHALGYAVQQGPAKLLAWAGGTEALRDMILARMNLDPNASAGALGLRPPLGG